MTTDPSSRTADRAERLARLPQRRVGGAATPPADRRGAPSERGPGKRAHAAAGGRIIAAGLSASAAVALLGTIGASAAKPTTGTTATPAAVTPSYVYVTVPTGAPSAPAAIPTATPTQPAASAVTRSGGS